MFTTSAVYAVHRFSIAAAHSWPWEIVFTQQSEYRDDTDGNDAVATKLETVVREGHEHEAMVLDVLKRAVAEALERKRKLGQYAVVWRDDRVLCIGPDALAASGVPSTGNPR